MKKYQVLLFAGKANDNANQALMADDAVQLNRMIHDRVKLFGQDVWWKAVVLPGGMQRTASVLNQAKKLMWTQCKHSVTFMSAQPNGWLKVDGNFFISERGLLANNLGQWAHKF